MRIAAINDTFFHSTGQIMRDVANYARMRGDDVTLFTSALLPINAQIPGHEYFGTESGHLRHRELGKRTGLNGCFDEEGTRRLIQRLDELDVQLVHLHNIHSFCLHLPTFFDYITRKNIPLVWTLHGCWAFTGKCSHYTYAGCDRWIYGCNDCPQLKRWPCSDVDTSGLLWEMKRHLFSQVPRMSVVGDSKWIADEAKRSYLKSKNVCAIQCGINLDVFTPTPGFFREQYGLEGKVILLGVAADWLRNKGIHSMIKLADKLDCRYQLVLVGVDDRVAEMLPKNVLALENVTSKSELAKIYTAADIFLQTTQEETFGLVNVEALACGTPVITFDVGGCAEIVDETCGRVVAPGDVDAMLAAIEEQVATCAMTSEACIKRAEWFSVERMCEEYYKLFHKMVEEPISVL